MYISENTIHVIVSQQLSLCQLCVPLGQTETLTEMTYWVQTHLIDFEFVRLACNEKNSLKTAVFNLT